MTGQLLNSSMRKSAMAPLPLDASKRDSALNKSMNHMDPSKIMAGPPSLVYAGFEGGASMSQKNLEQARSKYLLDKLTGKLPAELRHGKLQPIDGISDAGRAS